LRSTIAIFLAASLVVVPTEVVGGGASGSSQSREQIIKRCEENWQPSCAEYGVPKPEKAPSAVECAIRWRPGCPGEMETAQSLIQAGPSGVTYPTLLQFSATGFIRSGWPIVIKYRVPIGATATLTVTPQYGGGRPFNVALPQSTDGSVQLYSVGAEVAGSNNQVVVANYSITAHFRLPTGAIAAPVNILGFGAGPRAVGSIAIDDVRFAPPVVRRPTGNAAATLTYAYLLENDWDRVSEDLWRNCGRKIFCNWRHPNTPYRPLVHGRHVWSWPITRRTGIGQYHLVVRAWHTCGALANANEYKQCGDSLDWVIGTAGPVFIQ